MQQELGELQETRVDIKEKFMKTYETLTSLEFQGMSDQDIADFGFIMRSYEDLLKEYSKMCKKFREASGRVGGNRVLDGAMNDPENTEPNVKAELCTMMVEAAVSVKTPKPGTKEHFELIDFLKTEYPEGGDLDLDFNDMIRLHWPTLKAITNERIKEGKPMLPHVFPFQELNITYRRKS